MTDVKCEPKCWRCGKDWIPSHGFSFDTVKANPDEPQRLQLLCYSCLAYYVTFAREHGAVDEPELCLQTQ